MALILYGTVYTVLATGGLLLLRSRLEPADVAGAATDPAVYLGSACYAASFLTFLLALRRFEVLTVFPLFTGMSYAAVALGAVVFLDERMTPVRLAGLGLVGVGAVLLAREA